MARPLSSLAYTTFAYETADERAQEAGYSDAAQMRGDKWLKKAAKCNCGRQGTHLRYFIGRINSYPEVVCEECWHERNGNGNGHV
jgi:hypothetical protein